MDSEEDSPPSREVRSPLASFSGDLTTTLPGLTGLAWTAEPRSPRRAPNCAICIVFCFVLYGLRSDYCEYAVNIKQGNTERRNTTRNRIQHKQLRAQKRGTGFGGESLQEKEGSLVPFRREARQLFESKSTASRPAALVWRDDGFGWAAAAVLPDLTIHQARRSKF